MLFINASHCIRHALLPSVVLVLLVTLVSRRLDSLVDSIKIPCSRNDCCLTERVASSILSDSFAILVLFNSCDINSAHIHAYNAKIINISLTILTDRVSIFFFSRAAVNLSISDRYSAKILMLSEASDSSSRGPRIAERENTAGSPMCSWALQREV